MVMIYDVKHAKVERQLDDPWPEGEIRCFRHLPAQWFGKYWNILKHYLHPKCFSCQRFRYRMISPFFCLCHCDCSSQLASPMTVQQDAAGLSECPMLWLTGCPFSIDFHCRIFQAWWAICWGDVMRRDRRKEKEREREGRREKERRREREGEKKREREKEKARERER